MKEDTGHCGSESDESEVWITRTALQCQPESSCSGKRYRPYKANQKKPVWCPPGIRHDIMNVEKDQSRN